MRYLTQFMQSACVSKLYLNKKLLDPKPLQNQEKITQLCILYLGISYYI